MDKKIFVVGAPRSGTTYLARAMGLAEGVAYFEESGAFALFGARRFFNDYSKVFMHMDMFNYSSTASRILSFTDRLRNRDRLAQIVHSMLLHTKVMPYDLSPSNPLVEIQQCKLNADEKKIEKELIKKYRKLSEQGIRIFFSSFFEDFVQLSGKTHLIEKTPTHILYTPILISAFPDAKVVLIRRDKKDCAASYLRNFDARNANLINRISTNKMLLRKYCHSCLCYEPIEEWMEKQEWCRVVEYSAMVENPLGTVQDVLRWAGLFLDDKNHPMFQSCKAASKRNLLSHNEQKLVEDILNDL